MLTKIREAMKNEEGFTLIELMVVILIIGILMAIAIPSFFAVRNQAYKSAAQSVRTTAVKTIELWATDHDGQYVTAAGVAVTGVNLHALEPSITFADAVGTATDVAEVSGVDHDSFTITVRGRDNKVYTAIKAQGGAVAYNSP